MLKILNSEAKKHGLVVRIVRIENRTFQVLDREDGEILYESQLSEEVSCYFGRLEIAARFK